MSRYTDPFPDEYANAVSANSADRGGGGELLALSALLALACIRLRDLSRGRTKPHSRPGDCRMAAWDRPPRARVWTGGEQARGNARSAQPALPSGATCKPMERAVARVYFHPIAFANWVEIVGKRYGPPFLSKIA